MGACRCYAEGDAEVPLLPEESAPLRAFCLNLVSVL